MKRKISSRKLSCLLRKRMSKVQGHLSQRLRDPEKATQALGENCKGQYLFPIQSAAVPSWLKTHKKATSKATNHQVKETESAA